MAGLMAPNNFPIRNPKTRPQMNGRVVNQVGYPNIGGMTSSSRWPGENSMRVERPTAVKAGHKATGSED